MQTCIAINELVRSSNAIKKFLLYGIKTTSKQIIANKITVTI